MVGRAKRKTGKLFLLLGIMSICFLLGTVVLWVSLREGVRFDRLDLPSIHAQGIFLQTDRGIILVVERLDLEEQAGTGALPQPEILLERFLGWIHLVREIRVNRLFLNGQIYTLQYRNNVFTLSGRDFQIAATITYEKGKILLDIARLEFKPYSAVLSGTAEYVRESRSLLFKGVFSVFGINGSIDFGQSRDMIDADIRTEQFADLPALLAYLPLDPEALAWVTENISADSYIINSLHLGFTLKEERLERRPYSIYGTATATQAAIRFEESLPPVTCRRVHLSYENDQLAFTLEEPWYKDRSIDGSNVTIAPLLGKETTRLAITIKTESRLDEDIHELLRTYDIGLPFTQQAGTTRGELQLVFDLPDFTLHTNGTFLTGEGQWTVGDIHFLADTAKVQLLDDKVIIDMAEISYRDILQARVKGIVDTTVGQADLAADIQRFDIRAKKTDIVSIRDLSMPIAIHFSKDRTNIRLPALQTDIDISPSQKLVTLNDLNRLLQYNVSLKDFPLNQGSVAINVTGDEQFSFAGLLETDALPLLADSKPVTRFAFQGKRIPKGFTATVNEGRITLTAENELHIRLHDYLMPVDTDTIGRKAGPASPLPIYISGPGSRIKLKDISIPTKAFQAVLDGQNISFTAELEPGNLLFESDGRTMSLTAMEIDAMIAQDFFRFADLNGGKFNLSLKGSDEKNYDGYVEFSNVLIKDAALLNNVLSFINAIPALATFTAPGFDSDGYQVSQGIASFSRSGDLLTIQELRTDGMTMNTEADGWIDLENDIIKIKVELTSLKDYTKIISLIPWAGYAILGRDGSLSTSLLISGNRNDPEVTTSLPGEIVMLPINIVKRTVQWPFLLFDKLRDLAAEESASGEQSTPSPDGGRINKLYKISPP